MPRGAGEAAAPARPTSGEPVEQAGAAVGGWPCAWSTSRAPQAVFGARPAQPGAPTGSPCRRRATLPGERPFRARPAASHGPARRRRRSPGRMLTHGGALLAMGPAKGGRQGPHQGRGRMPGGIVEGATPVTPRPTSSSSEIGVARRSPCSCGHCRAAVEVETLAPCTAAISLVRAHCARVIATLHDAAGNGVTRQDHRVRRRRRPRRRPTAGTGGVAPHRQRQHLPGLSRRMCADPPCPWFFEAPNACHPRPGAGCARASPRHAPVKPRPRHLAPGAAPWYAEVKVTGCVGEGILSPRPRPGLPAATRGP